MPPTIIEIKLALALHEGTGKKTAFVFNDENGNVEFTFVTTIEAVQWAQESFPQVVLNNVQRLAPGDADPEAGSPYEPTEFPADNFGRSVVGETDKITDRYTISDPNSTQVFGVEFPTGTTLIDVYLRINSFGPDLSTKAPLTDLQVLEVKAAEYMSFGRQVFATLSEKVWAINVMAKNEGHGLTTEQLIALLSTSDTIEKALKTGSLDTAKYILGLLVAQFPQYSDAGNEAIAVIKDYQGQT